MSQKMILALATAVGVIAANLYYAQPLATIISQALGLAPEAAGLVVTLTQIGYGVGVLFIVPLGDIFESRRLILTMTLFTFISLLGMALSKNMVFYFLAAFATGVGASTVQIIIPYAASLALELKRGQLVGTLMSGLMVGIMLSRPIAGLMTDVFGWQSVFLLSSFLMVLVSALLYFILPPKEAENKNLSYQKLLGSMVTLYLTLPLLRRRAIYQAFMFGAFSLFWTAVPMLLSGPEFQLSQSAIALFALAGVAGAVSAPYAGRAADRGFIKEATLVAMLLSALSFLLSHLFSSGSPEALISLVISAILLDAGITANLVLGQRVIFSLKPEYRSRLNGLYVATIFVGGACGSALGAWAFASGGWWLTSWLGFLMPASALAFFLTEKSLPRTA